MEMVAAPLPATNGGTPFRDRDVREWSRIDSITGALERARLETDSWSAKTADSCHRYGKVVDSRAHTGADGSIQAKASRQLEVFQSRAAGARVQVVKTTTVSSSRWSGKAAETPPVISGIGFEDLQLPFNPLDTTSQKDKASVGRSVSRRPPTRHPRNSTSLAFSTDLHSHIRNAHFTAAANLHRVSRLCHQIHESAVRNAFGRKNSISSTKSTDDSASGVEITEITSNNSDLGSHSNLSRTKSNSSENIQQVPESNSTVKITEITDDTEQLRTWKRDSKVRRSLHIPKSSSPTNETIIDDLPENRVNVKKLRDELEKGRRLTQALRNNSISSDLNALDNIIQSISSASSLEKCSTDDNLDDASEKEESCNKKKKRDSFVSVESLQEVKSRLRRTSSPTSDIYNTNDNVPTKHENDSDDGIVTEDNKVKSYVFGMEKMLQAKKPMLGTGSLESRSKFTNGNNINKNEDWFNRRKSYGFEKVHNAEETPSISLKNKNVVESSTDSGICRSSEIMIVPTTTKSNLNDSNGRFNSESESDSENKTNCSNYNATNGIHYGKVKKMTSIFSQEDKKKDNQFSNSSRNKQNLQTTITIPIVKNNNIVDLSWNNETEKTHEITSNGVQESRFRKTSVVSNDHLLDDDNSYNNRRAKKVEFCKTEVHFAAESGKVNIVETDEKPPPTQNFRRRRRNSGPLRDPNEDYNKNGLPVLHFGDTSFEKTMFGISHDDDPDLRNVQNITSSNNIDNKAQIMSAFSIVTVNNNDLNNHVDCSEDEKMHSENDHLKGILKNKPIKPKPYHLGARFPLDTEISEDDSKWAVRRNMEKESNNDTPIWKSTVTVHNTFNKPENSTQPEFQKLLRNLRPTRRPDYLSDNESNRYSDSFANIRIVPTSKENRRSSWSVADQVPISDEMIENRGYSTKVTFGDGEATVIQNDLSTWPSSEIPEKDPKLVLNKGLVVRIGRQDSASKHTVCSKTTTRKNSNTTTTTKITIDLSPSPPTTDKQSPFTFTKFKRSQQLEHSFKSTPLVLNTIKGHGETVIVSRIPEQLEALRKLYEDIPSEDADSDADKEVQQLLSRAAERELNMLESDTSSVVSGSWSKMKAFKNLSDGKNSYRDTGSKCDLNSDKDMRDYSQRSEPKDSHKFIHTFNKYSIPSNTSKFSPVVLKKSVPIIQTDPIELNVDVENTKSVLDRKFSGSINHKSPTKEFRNIPDPKLQAKYNSDNIILRQPKKSEMTYFGVEVDSKNRGNVQTAVIRKEQKQLQKPDLLQHHKRSPSPTKKIMKPRRPTPEKELSRAPENEPIYENLRSLNKGTSKPKYSNGKDFDSSILEELTKAADQILQAVNGYTSEDCQNRLSSDDEIKKPLDTISETKSWRNSTDMDVKNQQRMRPTLASAAKMKVKRTSSTSSIESLSKERKKTLSTERRPMTGSASSSKPSLEKSGKKASSSDTASSKASTKARRLQRASSREALLQSHGSSSEDLPAKLEAPTRKPRLIKKTKAHQLTVTSGFELKKPPERRSRTEKVENSRNDSRIMGTLPEIRHRTAISAITTAAEKSSRDRSRTRSDDKSRSHAKKETSSRGTVSSTSTKYTTSTSRGHQSQQNQRGSSTKDSSGAALGVTQHRISTAYVPACTSRRRHKIAYSRQRRDDCPCLCS